MQLLQSVQVINNIGCCIIILILLTCVVYWMGIVRKMSEITKMTTPINPIVTSLMPLSQLLAWYLIIWKARINDGCTIQTFYNVLLVIASIYWTWALYDCFMDGLDLGVVSYGVLFIGSYIQRHIWAVIGTILVWLNYVIPSYYILYQWDVQQTAQIVKNNTTEQGIIWAYVFKGYFISNILLWSIASYRLLYSKKFYRILDYNIETSSDVSSITTVPTPLSGQSKGGGYEPIPPIQQ